LNNHEGVDIHGLDQKIKSWGLTLLVKENLELRYFLSNSTLLIFAMSYLSIVLYRAILAFFFLLVSFFSLGGLFWVRSEKLVLGLLGLLLDGSCEVSVLNFRSINTFKVNFGACWDNVGSVHSFKRNAVYFMGSGD